MSSAYQLLVEKKLELIIKSEKDDKIQMNVSELLRDLYIKIYQLEALIRQKSEPVAENVEPKAENS